MGQSECKGCSTSDPTTDTVTVKIGALGGTLLADAGASPKTSPKHQVPEEQLECQEEQIKHAEMERAREEEGRRLEVEEQQRLEHGRAAEEQRLERERAEAQARDVQRTLEQAKLAERTAAERAAAEAAARTAEEARKRAAEEKTRKDAQEKVDGFLKTKGFKTIAMPRTSCFTASYPLHVAVQENKADVVSALLLCGADKKVKNASGKTPLEAAEKLRKQGSHAAVLAALA